MIDYAIIGGGVSGVYSAWRLKEAYPDKTVVLFEYSDRIGGRLLTIQLPDMPDVNAELGGMRYIPEQHKLVDMVVKAMGLESEPFMMGAKGDPTGKNNLAYLRETHMKVGEMADSDKSPYKLHWSERGVMPDTLQADILNLLIPNHKDFSADDWFEVEVLGKPLWQWGLWNLLYKMLTPEAYRFLQEGSGYDTNVSNGNAVALLPTGSDYDGSTSYLAPKKGMQAIPLSLAEAFQSLGGDIHMNQRLTAIDKQGDGEYALTFRATKTQHGETSNVLPYEDTQCMAKNIILAMPRKSLEAVRWDQWEMNPFLRENLQSVLMQTAVKIVVGYDSAWWKPLGLEAGRSISDLPIRQTLYFGSQGATGVGVDKSLLLASYNDISTVPFWKGYEKDEPFGDQPADYLASTALVNEVHSQVTELHGQKTLPQPFAAAYMDWGKDPFGAGWHAWKAGYKYNEVMEKIRHPVPDENVFICGEAYSNDQGWAEGALETAEHMLIKDMNVPRHKMTENWEPDMMRRKYY